MDENMQVVLDCLAETIKRLRMDVQILKYENKSLQEKVDSYEKTMEKAGKNND